ncbi:MAG: hypothetical protein HC902_13015, partial [Calothrix sp. SM1_5_4]|nr:hypothetical protein [Calothrix sp. SM1_5_4]
MAQVMWEFNDEHGDELGLGTSYGLHALYIPRQQSPLLPSADSRWLPRQELLNTSPENPRIVVPAAYEYEYRSEIALDHALDHNWGLRLKARSGPLAVQLTHFDGASPYPKTRPSIEVSGPSGEKNLLSLTPVL